MEYTFLNSQAAEQIRAVHKNGQGTAATWGGVKIICARNIDMTRLISAARSFCMARLSACLRIPIQRNRFMQDIYRRAEWLVTGIKWWNGPGLDCDFRVYPVKYLPATLSQEVGVDISFLLDQICSVCPWTVFPHVTPASCKKGSAYFSGKQCGGQIVGNGVCNRTNFCKGIIVDTFEILAANIMRQ